jgi:two-component system phosphate regulon sensor histidine kinase PhoR
MFATLPREDTAEVVDHAPRGRGFDLSSFVPRTLGTRLALTYSVLSLVIIGALGWFLADTVRGFYLGQLEAELLQETQVVAQVVAPLVDDGAESEALASSVASLGEGLGARVTVIDAAGTVLADSASPSEPMDDHSERPEVREAERGGTGSSIRRSSTIGAPFFYVARAVTPGDFIVRLAVPLESIGALVWDIQRRIAIAAVVAAVLMTGAGLFVAQRIGKGLADIRGQAAAVAAGNLNVSVEPAPTQELGDLGRAFNLMTARLRATVTDLERARGRLEVTLANLSDGVIITDDREHVALANDAALVMLAAAGSVVGEPVVEVARDHELAEMVTEALASDNQVQERVIRHGRSGRMLQTAARRLDTAGERIGVVVLRDITELRRLEGVRRDFVANVSHELRTPLTSIRVLVETLESGALHDPDVSGDFLARIVGEVDRLTLLVDELLDLARIEAGRIRLSPESVAPAELVAHVVERMGPQVERAGLTVEVAVAEAIPPVNAGRERIDQVLLNLMHNAIKFTPAGGIITLASFPAEDAVQFEVRDTGVGVSPEDLPRIFERFFKTDRARHSQGTGLGLAIAKHIVQAHGGQIWAEPNPGGGTVFGFTLPVEFDEREGNQV